MSAIFIIELVKFGLDRIADQRYLPPTKSFWIGYEIY
jgi:hypothetical protein